MMMRVLGVVVYEHVCMRACAHVGAHISVSAAQSDVWALGCLLYELASLWWASELGDMACEG